MLLSILLICGIIFLDQISKWLIVIFVKGGEAVSVIPGILNFDYIENRGMAFGLLQDQRWLFMTLSTVFIVAIGYYLWRVRSVSKLQNIAIAFIIGGGIGNMIDRILLGYVVDFIDFCAFPTLWYYTFNVADAFVCVGAGLWIFFLARDLIREIKAEKSRKEGVLLSETDTPDAQADEIKDADNK